MWYSERITSGSMEKFSKCERSSCVNATAMPEGTNVLVMLCRYGDSFAAAATC